MENITLTLPNGYAVTFKPYLTHGQKRELTKFISSRMAVNPKTGQVDSSIDGATIFDAQDLTLKFILVSVQYPDGKTVTGGEAYETIQNMRDEDGEAVYKKLDEITANQSEADKKKLSLNSSNSSIQVGE